MLNIDLYPLLTQLSASLGQRYETWRRKKIISFLSRVNPERLEHWGEKAIVRAFRNAANRVPYYRDLLRQVGINPSSIKSIKEWGELPLLDKSIFQKAEIADLTIGGSLSNIKGILTSSGFSGKFSFGVNSKKNWQNTARMIDLVLDYALKIGSRKTLAINCLPMGVKMFTNEMVLAEVSVREDMALALIENFHKFFEQIIIVGEAFFLKSLVEEGVRSGLDWKSLNVSLIVGEDSFPESYRTYMQALLGISHDTYPMRRLIGSSLGVAEVDLCLFHETADTIRIRRFADTNLDFRRTLFGDELTAVPMLFQFYPQRTFIERDLGNHFSPTILTTTTFSPGDIPLIRYQTGDTSLVIPYKKTEKILRSFGKEDLVPQLKLPLIAVKSRHASTPGLTALADEVRDRIFRDPEIARRVTGYFKIRDNAEEKRIDLQLTKDVSTPENVAILKKRFIITGISINPIAYYDFHDALILNYNKKFHHT